MIKRILFFLMIPIFGFSQNELQDVFRLKLGLVGAWISYEKRISQKVSINGEMGYEGVLYPNQNSHYFNPQYVLTSTLSVESRLYLGINKRFQKGKSVTNNAFDFLSLKFNYVPNLGTIGNLRRMSDKNSLMTSINYGLVRNLSNNLQFELRTGFGYQFMKQDDGGLFPVLECRIGYPF